MKHVAEDVSHDTVAIQPHRTQFRIGFRVEFFDLIETRSLNHVGIETLSDAREKVVE